MANLSNLRSIVPGESLGATLMQVVVELEGECSLDTIEQRFDVWFTGDYDTATGPSRDEICVWLHKRLRQYCMQRDMTQPLESGLYIQQEFTIMSSSLIRENFSRLEERVQQLEKALRAVKDNVNNLELD